LARRDALTLFRTLDGMRTCHRDVLPNANRPSCRPFCIEGAFPFQSQQVVRYRRSVMGSAENFVLVLLQCLD